MCWICFGTLVLIHRYANQPLTCRGGQAFHVANGTVLQYGKVWWVNSAANDDSSGGSPSKMPQRLVKCSSPRYLESHLWGVSLVESAIWLVGHCDLCQKRNFYLSFIFLIYLDDGHHLIEHSRKRWSKSLDLLCYAVPVRISPQTNGLDQLEGLPSAQHVNCPNPHLVEIQEHICGAK